MSELAGHILRTSAVWLFIMTLAWAPFPLGGAIAWAAGVQEILIALCWGLWVGGTISSEEGSRGGRLIVLPAVLALFALAWALVQIMPGVPPGLVHPAWNMAAEALGSPVQGFISLDPWRSEAEILKLLSYVMAAWLVFRMAQRSGTAELLLKALIVIGAMYALYAFLLEFLGFQQTNVFYSIPYHNPLLSGPFMLHNSFATYAGMAALAAVGKFFAAGIGVRRGHRIEAALQYCFGRGAVWLIAVLLTFGAVVASASRAGFVATMCGLLTLALTSLAILHGRKSKLIGTVGVFVTAMPLLLLIILNGDTLGSRIDQLLASDTGDAIRFSLWAATRRMIADAPWLGLGLGTFEDAYPMYASKVFPYVMDKAHCDYLEFAAGIGLPAAVAWWSALMWLTGLCLRGVFVRHHNRHYAIIAFGASILVAVHSSVDFSLQLPAVALSYATLLGLGVAQSFSHARTAS